MRVCFTTSWIGIYKLDAIVYIHLNVRKCHTDLINRFVRFYRKFYVDEKLGFISRTIGLMFMYVDKLVWHVVHYDKCIHIRERDKIFDFTIFFLYICGWENERFHNVAFHDVACRLGCPKKKNVLNFLNYSQSNKQC